MRFRQVHLDFHTSPAIDKVGEAFDKKAFQARLQKAAVDSITCFSLCHHGLSYHPTKFGVMHPHLKFNLLRAQIDACHEIDIKVPVYLTAGINNVEAERHPEWREITAEGSFGGWVKSPLDPGFKKLCFNTPYLDHLCRMIEEACEMFPDNDGIFLDIIYQGECCCEACRNGMLKAGLDPRNQEHRKDYSAQVLLKYYAATTAAARKLNPENRIFHNSGHVSPAWLDRLKYFSHLELESLPTGGWGYDHFPQSAAFARKTGMEFLGMTGKFHSTWGEFGGLKHPNALKYECSSMLALGAKCSIGDQLHPCGELDESTYEVIGAAYRDVKAKEEFCRTAVNVADIAMIPQEAFSQCTGHDQHFYGDVGASRILLEGHYLFDLVAPSMDFSHYKMVILPDNIVIDAKLQKRLDQYLAKGGKLLIYGKGAAAVNVDLGGKFENKVAEFNPTYIKMNEKFAPAFCTTPVVMYSSNYLFKAAAKYSLGDVYFPYFNRTFEHFCSHQHTPYRTTASGYSAGAVKGNILYFAYNFFELYYYTGSVVLREYLDNILRQFLAQNLSLSTNLPSMARVTLTEDKANKRAVAHFLFAPTVKRGAGVPGSSFFAKDVEVVEEFVPLGNIECEVAVAKKVRRVKLQPQNTEIAFAQAAGKCKFKIDTFSCHQMAVLEF